MAPKKATPVAAAPVVPEPVKKAADVSEKKTVTKKPVVEAAPVVAPAATEDPIVVSTFEELVSKINSFASMLKETQTLLKALSKEYDRMKKTVEKTERKRANARTNPNGFAKPAKITDEMHEFLGVPKGTEISRTDVTRRVNAYIKEHNLYNPTNKRIILPDDKLRKILGVKADQEVTFFNLQRFLSASFIKKP